MKINDGQLYDIDGTYQEFVDFYREKLGNFRTAIDTFSGIDTMTGITADSIKSYFTNNHKTLISMLESYLSQVLFLQEKYFNYLILDIDDSDCSALGSEVLSKCANDFAIIKESLVSSTSKLHTSINSVSDIVDLNSLFSENFGSYKYGLIIDKFNGIISSAEAMKAQLELDDETEATGQILEVIAYREAINTLINEMKGKEVSEVEGYWHGRLEDCNSYELADEAFNESKEYLDSVKGEEYGKAIEDAYDEYRSKEVTLNWNAAGNVISNGFDIYDGVTTFMMGVPLLSNPITFPLGVMICGYGAGETVTSVYDLFYGTASYYQAQKAGNVDFEYQDTTDKLIENLFGGSEFCYDAADTAIGVPITFCEAYSKIDAPIPNKTKLILAGGYTVLDLAMNTVVVPFAECVTTAIVEEFKGSDMGSDIEDGKDSVLGNMFDQATDWLWDRI